MRFSEKKVSVALIRSSDEHIVMGRKWPRSNGAYNNKWILPGGVIEDGETSDEAVIRETLEETGLDIAPFQRIPLDIAYYDDDVFPLQSKMLVCRRMHFKTYLVRTLRPAASMPLNSSSELEIARWVPVGQLSEYAVDICRPSLALFQTLGLLTTRAA